jgi:hypothetical protein
MKYLTALTLIFWAIRASAETFPATMGELYCLKTGNKAEACLNISLEKAYCMNQFSSVECREFSGPELCRKSSHTKEECKTKSFIEGYCLFSGLPLEECRNVTVAKLMCKKSGRTSEDCAGVTEAETMCMNAGVTSSDCKGIKLAEMLCFDSRKDFAFCKGITLSQIPCVKKGFSRDQMAKGCD